MTDPAIFIKSVLEQDPAPIVLCDLAHIVVYMNPAALKRYKRDLTGQSLLLCHGPESRARIFQTVEWFSTSAEHNRIYESRNDAENKDVYMVALRDDSGHLIGYYEKHEYRDRETEIPYAALDE